MRSFKTALYGRTSKDDPRRVTIDIQKATLRDWSLRDEFIEKVVDEYWDEGVSGKLPLLKRPEGQRLLADVKAGRLDSVAVAYVDRFGRTLLDGLLAAAELEKAGVKVVAVADGWDARRDDDPMYFQFRLMIAEAEHRRIKERMESGKRRAMDRDNAPPGGPLTFGYRMDSHGHYVLDPAEAPIVIRIFELALSGWSNPEILEWVKTTTVLPGRKYQKRTAGSLPIVASKHLHAVWRANKIARILTCKTYLGVRLWAGREFPCPPLIDPQTFQKVQVLQRAKGSHFGPVTEDSAKGLVSGLFKCGLCGAPFYHKPTVHYRKSGKVVRYQKYVCYGQRRNCLAKMLNVPEVDAFIWEAVKASLADPEEMLQKAIHGESNRADDAASLATVENRHMTSLEAIENEVRDVWSEQKAHNWPIAWVSPRLEELNRQREAILKQVAEVRRQRADLTLDREQMERVVSLIASARARMNGGQPISQAERRFIVRTLIPGGVVHTHGTGRTKTATINLNLFLTGERRLDFASPEIPKIDAMDRTGIHAIQQSLTVSRAN